MCDTFVARGAATADGATVFGKNSDREPNEAQVLEYHPRREAAAGAELKLTYRTIPQVRETRAVILSRPFWMWGAEIGANEDGVAIGNEAVWSKLPQSLKPGLTGMDMLRLALERSTTAGQALETIVGLLRDHGQSGICGYQNRKLTYHNSFIIADPEETWVLETAGSLWAARRVAEAASISNGLTIGEEIDRMHPDLIPTARKKGWLKKSGTFHFARCYADWFYTTFSACRRRQSRSLELIGEKRGMMDAAAAMAILRDHSGNGYRPDGHFLGNRVCAHAGSGPARKGMQTTASLIAHLPKDGRSATFWATGTAAPCTSIFKPVWFGENALPDLGRASAGRFDEKTLYWRHERFHRTVLQDYGNRLRFFQEEQAEIERELIVNAGRIPSGERSAFTARAFAEADQKTAEWLAQIRDLPVRKKTGFFYRSFWNRQNRAAGIS